MITATSSNSSTAPPDATTLCVSFFSNKTDTTVAQRDMVLGDLALMLSYHQERPAKDGPMFACVRYQDGATRGTDGIVEATAFVLDVDGYEPDWALLQPYRYVAFTTHSHEVTKPSAWRIVLFSAAPIRADQWAEAFERVTFDLCPNADPGAKALAQPHYRPSYQPGMTPATRDHAGALLDWRQLPALPTPPPRERRAPSSARQDRPGDDFNARADWADVLPDWTYVHTCRDGTERWRRPGKDEGWSGTINYAGSDMLYVWTSSAKPLEARTAYDKFGAYALLHHAGDHRVAARAVRQQGYGAQSLELGHTQLVAPPTTNENGHTTYAPREYPLTDLGNTERLVDAYGDKLRYCWTFNEWFAWTGARWQEDTRGQVYQYAKRTIRAMYAEAATIEDDKQRGALVAHARRSEAAGRLEALVRLARSEPRIAVTPEDFDRDHWLLNCPNGTVDLRTGELRPHRREDLITKSTAAEYDPTATCLTFEAFLERVLPDAGVRQFVQRFAGYAATGDTSEQAIVFPFGGGANGKSTLLNQLMAALGDYAKQAAPDLLTYSPNDRHPTELADLAGVRFIASIEVEEGKRLAEALVKQMSGGDRMKARRMRENFFEFQPTHKIFLAANHRPVIRGTDYAIWRRVHLVPFDVTIPPEQQDKQLPAKLHAELAGILRWIVDGCLAWQRAGLGVPEAVRAATAEYRAEQDVLADFLAECCEFSPTARATTKVLYAAYSAWCESNGERVLSKKALSPRLQERGCQPDRTMSARGWVGLKLRPAENGTDDIYDA